ncbi:MAG: T9SS type A sorting domain-containing protein, partial [Chitinophagales bacterium]|nr:T9SS type A sorting domain-containing protein [Chitinophagales bacterium]
IKVYDRLGQSVIEQVSNGGSTQIDLSLLNSGLYFIQATGPQKTLTGKVLKQ